MLVKTDLALSGLKTFFHDPANSRHPHQLGERDWTRCPTAVERQFTGRMVAADQQTVPAVVVRITVGADVGQPGPVVDPWSFPPGAGAAPGLRGGEQVGGQPVVL
ncbi:hypothetical protein [Actinoplanes sp. TFC3]|uniref:hypothetical protein n=1 Tax=Actinoplanes sp. TFC3 TaxID=1710355 RepID=UPI0012907283|nr:hypothetical protein [Actinoplanes sp. TFC3]